MADLTVGAIYGFPDRDRLGRSSDGIDEVVGLTALRQNEDKQQGDTKGGGPCGSYPQGPPVKPPHGPP